MKLNVSLEAAGCHNSCRHCYNSQGGPARDFLSAQEVLSIREEIARLGVPFDFGFPNGHMIHSEWRTLWPVMHKEIYCGQVNGCTMVDDTDYRTTISEMMQMGLRRVQLTFYGLEDTHNRFANSKDAFAYDVGAARRFMECGVPIEQVQIVCHRDNLHEIDEIIHFAETLQGHDVLAGGELMFPALVGRWMQNQALRVNREDYSALSDRARSLPHWQDLSTEAEWIRQVQDGALSPSLWMQDQIVKRSSDIRLYIDRHLVVWDNSDHSHRRRLGSFEIDPLPAIVESYKASPDPAWCLLASMGDAEIIDQYATGSDTALNTKKDIMALWLLRCRKKETDRTRCCTVSPHSAEP
ncbi:MAG: hypothetical protein PHP44_05920 [Kiritimatiellae bacterium]|nr:hypothetical protein [Kiritimatiellia bacterium]